MNHSSKILKSMTLCLVIFISASFFTQADAKRGCSSFGHSCFGGHGKRSNGDIGTNQALRSLQSGSLLNQQGNRMGQDEVAAPRPVYPQTINDLLGNGDDIIPIRNGGFTDNSEEINDDQLRLHLSPYLRNWLIAYRKSQDGNNGYLYNNLN